MRVLFVMRHAGYMRNFEWFIRTLAERGHSIHLAFERERSDVDVLRRLEAEHPGLVTSGFAPIRSDAWVALAAALAASIDFLRYRTPLYRDSVFLRERAARGVPRLLVHATAGTFGGSPRFIVLLDRALRRWASSVPVSRALTAYLRERRPDVVIVTPLVSEPDQHELVRSARSLGITSILAVHSWDNLTNKGVIREAPDRTYVWNETQRDEAIGLHGLAPGSVVAVGAHSYDHWFSWEPSEERAAFCARVGLDAGRPYLLYVGSSFQIAPDEPAFVLRWLEGIRAEADLRELGILVRPHPYNGKIWTGNPLAGLPDVTVWPPQGAEPRDAARRAEYFDSIHHSAAVVGLNTSALIEAAIVGRRTYTVVLPDRRDSQEGTVHFHYLVRENGGPLVVAHSLPEHVGHLREAFKAPESDAWRDGFVRSFLRPNGADSAAAPRLADDLERFVAESCRPAQLTGGGLLAALTFPLAWLTQYLSRGTPGRAAEIRLGDERRPSKGALRRWSKRGTRGVRRIRRRSIALLRRLRR